MARRTHAPGIAGATRCPVPLTGDFLSNCGATRASRRVGAASHDHDRGDFLSNCGATRARGRAIALWLVDLAPWLRSSSSLAITYVALVITYVALVIRGVYTKARVKPAVNPPPANEAPTLAPL